MGKKYNYEEVKAFVLIGLHNLSHSGNNDCIRIKDFFRLFVDPLEEIYKDSNIIELSKKFKND